MSMRTGDTFESLKAAYEAHVGGAYETAEEEAQRLWEKGKAARDAKYKAARDAERKIIEDAKAQRLPRSVRHRGILGLWSRLKWQAA